jgi:hypothetical protein
MSQGFKKCRSCGARNRERHDDCVRCGKPLAPVGPESSLSLPLNKPTLVVAGVIALGIGVAAFRWMATETEDETPVLRARNLPSLKLLPLRRARRVKHRGDSERPKRQPAWEWKPFKEVTT